MRSLYLTEPFRFDCRETPSPQAKPGWIRLRMRYVGICGSDVHYYATGRIGDQVISQYPFILGHEGSGEILDGAGHFAKDMPIYVEPAISCHRCDQCLAGRENTCRNLKFLGNPLEQAGCMSDEILMPPECIMPIPKWMGLEEAVLLEPLSIAIYSVLRSGVESGCSATIIGAGPIGLSVLLALRDRGARQVLVSEPVPARLQAAQRLGADAVFSPGEDGAAAAITQESEGGVDVAFDCAGTQEAIDDATLSLKPGGTLVLIGITENPGRLTYNPHLMRRREITVVNIRRQNKCVDRAIAVLQNRRDAARILITHRFPPTKAAEAFDMVHHKVNGAIKALINF
jgi:L-iditol 2-dehydrogenase